MLKGIRILYIHQYFATPADAGGTRSYELARRMVADGAHVTILTTRAMRGRGRWQFSRERLDEHLIVYSLPSQYSNSSSPVMRSLEWLLLSFLSSCVAVIVRADLLYCTSTPPTVLMPAYVANKARHLPFIFEVRDVWPQAMVALGVIGRDGFAARTISRLVEWGYSKSHAIVTLSEDMARIIIDHNSVFASKTFVAPNGFSRSAEDISHQCRDCLPLREDLATPGHVSIVYAGTFGLVNDLCSILPVVERTPHTYRFFFVGDGSQKDELQTRVRSSPALEERVRIFGPVSKQCLPGIIASADASLSTVANVQELAANSANKVFDSLAVGTPVILNHGGWLSEVLERFGAGVIIPFGKPDLAAKMLSRLEDPVEVRMLRQGVEELRPTFSLDTIYPVVRQAVTRALAN